MIESLEKLYSSIKTKYGWIGTIAAGLAGIFWGIDKLVDERLSRNVGTWIVNLWSFIFGERPMSVFALVLAFLAGAVVVLVPSLRMLRALKRQRLALEEAKKLSDETYGREMAATRKEIELLKAGRLIDKLTEVKNREGLEIDFPTRLGLLKAKSQAFCLAYIDIVGFKEINKEIDHERANGVLKQFASIIKNELRGGDELYRLNDEFYRLEGDQFALILSNENVLDAKKGALRLNRVLLGKEFRAGIDPRTKKPFRPIYLACRYGITDCTAKDELKDCLRRADAALNLAKRHDTSDGKDEDAVQIVTRQDAELDSELVPGR